MAVSPIYLESLKTYEHYAGSESLFTNALDHFGLRNATGHAPIETLKRKMLKVEIVRNTRILEISITFPDPAKAHALANFIADATIQLANSTIAESNRDLVRGIEQEAQEVRARLQQTEDEWSKLLSTEPIAELESAMEAAGNLRSKLEEYIAASDLEIADNAARLKQAKPGQQAEIQLQSQNAQARSAEMRKQLEDVGRRNTERERLFSIRRAHRDKLESERKARLAELATVETRLREARGEAGYRGERLKIIDRGIVPERPSSPNIPLNLAGALIASLTLSILYVTFEMNCREGRAATPRTVLKIRQAGDD